MLRRLSLLMALLLWAPPLGAHESRPAYLQAGEISPGRFEVLWKRPALGDRGGFGAALARGVPRCAARQSAAGAGGHRRAARHRLRPDRPDRPAPCRRRLARHQDRRTGAHRVPRWARADEFAQAGLAGRRRRQTSAGARSGKRLFRARRRAHPRRHRSSALRARARLHRSEPGLAGQDHHRVHGRP